MPVNFGELFSREACDRLMPGLRVLATAFNGLPGMIPLHGGLPPREAFPLSSMQLTLKDGTTIDINDPSEVAPVTSFACWDQHLEAGVYVKVRLLMQCFLYRWAENEVLWCAGECSPAVQPHAEGPPNAAPMGDRAYAGAARSRPWPRDHSHRRQQLHFGGKALLSATALSSAASCLLCCLFADFFQSKNLTPDRIGIALLSQLRG